MWVEPVCGSIRCVAGWAAELAGCQAAIGDEVEQWLDLNYGTTLEYVTLPAEYTITDGFEPWTSGPPVPGVFHIRDAAMLVLGLTNVEAKKLFDPFNTWPNILHYVAKWAGEDGVEIPEWMTQELRLVQA